MVAGGGVGAEIGGAGFSVTTGSRTGTIGGAGRVSGTGPFTAGTPAIGEAAICAICAAWEWLR